MEDHSIFKQAVESGRIDKVKLVLENTHGDGKQNMIHSDEDFAFKQAVESGLYDIVKLLLENTNGDGKQKMIHLDEDFAFKEAVESGLYDIVKLLLENTHGDGKQIMIHSNRDFAFREASSLGQLDFLEIVLENTNGDGKQKMIHLDEDFAFKEAVSFGSFGLVKLLVENTYGDGKQKMIHFNQDEAFKEAVKFYRFDVVKLLLENTDDLLTNPLENWLPNLNERQRNELLLLVFEIYGPNVIPLEYLDVVKVEWIKIVDSKSVEDVAHKYSLAMCNLYESELEISPIISNLIDCKDKTLANLAVIRLILRRFKGININDGWMTTDQACEKLQSITLDDIHKTCL
jgi:hypothetical protein